MMKLVLSIFLVLAPYGLAYHTSDLQESGANLTTVIEHHEMEDNTINSTFTYISDKFNLRRLVSFIRKTEDFIGKVNSGFSLYGHDEGPGEENWGGVCASGKAQSPIDFKRNETTIVKEMDELRFSGISQIPSITNITHSGDTVKVLLKTAKPITVTGGVFNDKVYEFQQLHFHWGKNTHEGSEHTVESRRFPLECHLVFYKANTTDPTAEPDGIAVLGVHYETKWVGSNVLDPIVKAVTAIEKVDEYVAKVNGYPLKQYFPKRLDSYFSYTGSLTTPPCTEGVTWIWFSETMKVSQHQINLLHEITDEYGHKVQSNFRGTQSLNGRTVYLVKPWW